MTSRNAMPQTITPVAEQSISALILAGGRAQRMQGCDKGLVELQGMPMICHVIERLQPQLGLIRINANRNQSTYAALGVVDTSFSNKMSKKKSNKANNQPQPYTVISDSLSDFQGPLAGIAQGLQDCPTEWMLVVPCDTPLLPKDLVERMVQQQRCSNAEIVVAHDGQRLQPVVALINRTLHPSLLDYLAGGDRKIDRWYAMHTFSKVDFSHESQAFLNINSLRDKQLLENQVV
ncbi:MAG: molybdenum cofactor guanylyltransferase [Motiliproteus sp.]